MIRISKTDPPSPKEGYGETREVIIIVKEAEILQTCFVPDEGGNLVDGDGNLRIDSVVPSLEKEDSSVPTSQEKVLFRDGFCLLELLAEIDEREKSGIK